MTVQRRPTPGTRRPARLAIAAMAAFTAGCGGASAGDAQDPLLDPGEPAPSASTTARTAPAAAQPVSRPARARRSRPELRIAMGEWAVAPAARSVPPGPITLVISNRGKVDHGFEIKAESGSGRDGSGRLELQSGVIQPGRTVRMRITLPAGEYEIECFVADHDDRGMEGLMQVRPGAPRPRQTRAAGSATGVRIDGFAFAPRTISVKAGQSVTWRNADAAEHTVTETPGGFSSKSMGRGDGYTRRFTKAGRYSYLCALHPGMKGMVDVKR
ncbi:MAG: hypothetical protein QOH46_576 [Solirubrobacteraceae bacterium]|nr:hypothetical protein [Solirubrobacteraceae bacterium]